MKQYLLKKWIVIIASLMASSLSFAKGGNTAHVVVQPTDGGVTFRVYMPPAPRRAETRDAGTQTEATPTEVVVPEAPEEELSGSGRTLADLKARGASDLVVLTRELLDELAHVAKCVLPNDREFGTSGISLSDRFATLQEQEDDMQRAILGSYEVAVKEEAHDRDIAEAEAISKALEQSQEELETEDAIALVAELERSQEAKEVAAAINKVARFIERERVNARQAAILLVKMAFIKRIILDAIVRQSLLRSFLQELLSPQEPSFPVFSQRTCREESLAGNRFSHLLEDELFEGTGSGSRTPAPTERTDTTTSFDDGFEDALRRGFAAARARGRSVFEPASRPIRATPERRRDAQGSPTSVTQLVVSAPAPAPAPLHHIDADVMRELIDLKGMLGDYTIEGVDYIGTAARELLEQLLRGEFPSFDALQTVAEQRAVYVTEIEGHFSALAAARSSKTRKRKSVKPVKLAKLNPRKQNRELSWIGTVCESEHLIDGIFKAAILLTSSRIGKAAAEEQIGKIVAINKSRRDFKQAFVQRYGFTGFKVIE